MLTRQSRIRKTVEKMSISLLTRASCIIQSTAINVPVRPTPALSQAHIIIVGCNSMKMYCVQFKRYLISNTTCNEREWELVMKLVRQQDYERLQQSEREPRDSQGTRDQANL